MAAPEGTQIAQQQKVETTGSKVDKPLAQESQKNRFSAPRRMAARIKGMFNRNRENPDAVLHFVGESSVLAERPKGRLKSATEKFLGNRRIKKIRHGLILIRTYKP